MRAARVPLRAQQHRSCVIILCTSRLWVRARAAALVLAAVGCRCCWLLVGGFTSQRAKLVLFMRYSWCCSGALLALFLRYSCVVLALFLRCSCVVLALFRCYPVFISLLFWLFIPLLSGLYFFISLLFWLIILVAPPPPPARDP